MCPFWMMGEGRYARRTGPGSGSLDYPQQLPFELGVGVVLQQEFAVSLAGAGAVPQQDDSLAAVVVPQQEDSLAAVVVPQQEEAVVGRPTAFLTRFTKTVLFSDMMEASFCIHEADCDGEVCLINFF